jgi:NAD(P)-dependent dehydrogenase (short-subunit alcohol dehydrogenase family)
MQKKAVFITGASRGIGRALAEKFLKENYYVIGTSTSGKPSFKDKNLVFLKLDLSSTNSIKTCLKEFLKLNKRIDILINNAGTWSGKEYGAEIHMNDLRKVLEVNLFGTIDLTERLISYITNPGKIINISSRAGSLDHTKKRAYYPDYKISKAALNMYTRTLAIRLKARKIVVASIHPGWVKTDMGGKDADLKPEEAATNIYNRIISLNETGQFWFNQDKFPW